MARPRTVPRWEHIGFRTDPQMVRIATEVTCEVRDNPFAARLALVGIGADELADLALTLAAMVPDDRSAADLLAWVKTPRRVLAWREALTAEECNYWHAAWGRGERGWSARHGNREWERRRSVRYKAARAAEERRAG